MPVRKRILPPPPSPSRKRGGQPGNRNAVKHGRSTRQWRDLRASIDSHVRRTYTLLDELGLFQSRRRVDMPEKPAIKAKLAI